MLLYKVTITPQQADFPGKGKGKGGAATNPQGKKRPRSSLSGSPRGSDAQ